MRRKKGIICEGENRKPFNVVGKVKWCRVRVSCLVDVLGKRISDEFYLLVDIVVKMCFMVFYRVCCSVLSRLL